MEDPEVPLEEVQEHINEHAHGHAHGDVHKSRSWTMGVALSTALFAALAAVASLLAGQKANDAMSAQLESANQWNYYQAKSIKDNLLETKDALLTALGHAIDATDAAKLKEYEEDKSNIKVQAEFQKEEAKSLLEQHETIAYSVTMFQVAIALGAIAVLTGLRSFWFISLGLGILGSACFMNGLYPGKAKTHEATRSAVTNAAPAPAAGEPPSAPPH
jgi:hypothetical protein